MANIFNSLRDKAGEMYDNAKKSYNKAETQMSHDKESEMAAMMKKAKEMMGGMQSMYNRMKGMK